MSAAVVWVNHSEAKIFRLMPNQKPVGEKLEGGPHGHNDGKKQHDIDKFFHTLSGRLDGVKEVLLVGPGTAKQEYKHYLEKHNAALAKCIVGMENADHPTDNQILALARKFFHAYDLYSGT